MTKIRTAAPNVLAVTLADAKAALRIDGDDMDTLVTIWTKGIIAALEHETGQCMMEQTWKVSLPAFPACSAIELPHPVIDVTSVGYIDQDGVTQLLTSDVYRINRTRYTTTLSPARGTSWPATAEDDAAVVVMVKCGYGSTPDKTPEDAQLFILGKLVEQFDPTTRLERDTVQSTFLDGLIDSLRTYA